ARSVGGRGELEGGFGVFEDAVEGLVGALAFPAEAPGGGGEPFGVVGEVLEEGSFVGGPEVPREAGEGGERWGVGLERLAAAVAGERGDGGGELGRGGRQDARELGDALGVLRVRVGGVEVVLAAFGEREGAAFVEGDEAVLDHGDEFGWVDAYGAAVVDGA